MPLLQFRISRKVYLACLPISFVTVFVLWASLSWSGLVRPFFFPPPGEIIADVLKLFRDHSYLDDIHSSVLRVFSGFALSAVIGVLLGS